MSPRASRQSNQPASCTTHSLPDKGKRFVLSYFNLSVKKREKGSMSINKVFDIKHFLFYLKLDTVFLKLNSNPTLFFNRKLSEI